MGDESRFFIVGGGPESEAPHSNTETSAAVLEPPQLLDDGVATGGLVVESAETIDPGGASRLGGADPVDPQEEETSIDVAPAEDDDASEPDKPKKLKKKQYKKQLVERHLDWRDLERKVERDALKLVILIEGRDNGKKGGVVNRIAEFSDPRICRVARVDPPNGRERTQWFFQPYVAHLPANGEIVLFDGSWYGRAALERATAKSSDRVFAQTLAACAEFESLLRRSGILIFKCWISADETAADLAADLQNLGKRWDIDSDDFDPAVDLVDLKGKMLAVEDGAPWHIIGGEDKRAARVDAIRAIVAAFAGESGEPHESGVVAEHGAELPAVSPPDGNA